MAIFLGVLIFFLVMVILIFALVIGLGFVLHWLIPAVALDMALLIAALVVGQCLLFWGRIVDSPPPRTDEGDDDFLEGPQVVFLDRELPLPRRRRKPK